MKEFFEAFKALRHAPRALWLVIFAFSLDGMAYFGTLPLMKPYLHADIGIRPELASTWVSFFTAALTLLMIFVGRPAEEKFGIRNGVLVAMVTIILGRGLYGGAPFFGGQGTLLVALAIMALGEAVLQPVAYSAVKAYTNEKNGAMGYAMLYAFMNLGSALIGPVSAEVRTTFDVKHAAGTTALSGFNAVNWVCFGVTVGTTVVFGLLMNKQVESNVVRVIRAEPNASATVSGPSPFKDVRFLFFIFALLPVRTLFAHQWLTMPEYVLRTYDESVTSRMEWFVDSINPIVIFLGVPVLTALTKRFHVLTMMIVGSSVSACATFLLCFGEHTSMLVAYFVVFSIGEALWSSRFLEYTAELAPEGRVAQYMGVANLPWFVAKVTTGLYSGFVLEHFVPKDGAKNASAMWLLYGLVAIVSPVLLIAARRWVLAGMHRPAHAAADGAAAAPPGAAATDERVA